MTDLNKARDVAQRLRECEYPKTYAFTDIPLPAHEAIGTIDSLVAEVERLTKDTARLNFIEANPTKSLRYHKKRWAFVGLTSYEYETYRTPREAIDAVMGEVGINGLTAAETLQTASVMGLTKVDSTLIGEGTKVDVEPVLRPCACRFDKGVLAEPCKYHGSANASALAAEQAKVRELVEVLRKTLVSMEEAVAWQETRIGRPPNQTCLFEIEEARAAIKKYGEQK